jgi:hypothetical protein
MIDRSGTAGRETGTRGSETAWKETLATDNPIEVPVTAAVGSPPRGPIPHVTTVMNPTANGPGWTSIRTVGGSRHRLLQRDVGMRRHRSLHHRRGDSPPRTGHRRTGQPLALLLVAAAP